jgi:parvulin-like peptidyl-prolyl isomerase
MRQTLNILVLFVFFLAFALEGSLQAEVIDKVVAVVDGHIITASDMRQERDILMRLNEKPVDDDKALVQQLIDNYLIETQIADFPGIEVTDADVTAQLEKSVAREGAPSQALREAIRLRIRMQKYFEMRFGQFISASDEDVNKYYNAVFVPEAQNRGLNPIPALAEVSDLVRNNVIQESLHHEITIWLEAIRRRSNLEVFE